jgi:hypothetical protein
MFQLVSIHFLGALDTTNSLFGQDIIAKFDEVTWLFVKYCSILA